MPFRNSVILAFYMMQAAILQRYFRKVAKAETMRCLSEVNPLSYSGLGNDSFFPSFSCIILISTVASKVKEEQQVSIISVFKFNKTQTIILRNT